jgi:hypothetical protein
MARKIKYQENKENLRRVAVRNNSADSAEAKGKRAFITRCKVPYPNEMSVAQLNSKM